MITLQSQSDYDLKTKTERANCHKFPSSLCMPFAFSIRKRVRPGHTTNFRWGDSGRVAYGITTQLQQI